jgi:plasmid stabilization system protein ParE
MGVSYHPLVRRDMLEILRYYHNISPRLADELRGEVRAIIAAAGRHPLRFHLADRGFRRANLKRFPYHVLYDVQREHIRVMIVRHNKRHPDFGLDRH